MLSFDLVSPFMGGCPWLNTQKLFIDHSVPFLRMDLSVSIITEDEISLGAGMALSLIDFAQSSE
jgi:hypothetical protein